MEQAELPKSKEETLLALMEKTGYNIVQENGQRLYGPPPNWQGDPPSKGTEVFVGKIPRDLYEDEIVPVFETQGQIYQIRLMMDFSGCNRGFGFVMYAHPEDAKKAIRCLDNYEIRRGKFIGVCMSVDNCRLFVGGIPKTKGKEDIMEEMEKITEGVVDVILYPSVVDKAKNRGFAFVEYENHRSAAMARRKLIPGKILLWGHEIAVDWAEPEPEIDEDTMSKVTILYVRNLMLSTTEEQIRDTFSISGTLKVEKVKKLRDFAFVHYRSRQDAEEALRLLNKSELDGADLEVTWAKPADRVKKGGRQLVTPVQVNAFTPLVYATSNTGYDLMGYNPPYGFNSAANAGPNNSEYSRGMMLTPRVTVRGRGRGAAGLRGARGHFQNYFRAPVYRKSYEHFLDLQPNMELIPTNPFTLKPARYPLQILQELCQKSNWGEPVFQLMSSVQPVNNENMQMFNYKVTLPGLASNYNVFNPPKLCQYMEEAKQYAAEFVLTQLGISVDNVDLGLTMQNGSYLSSPPSSTSAANAVFQQSPRIGYVTPTQAYSEYYEAAMPPQLY